MAGGMLRTAGYRGPGAGKGNAGLGAGSRGGRKITPAGYGGKGSGRRSADVPGEPRDLDRGSKSGLRPGLSDPRELREPQPLPPVTCRGGTATSSRGAQRPMGSLGEPRPISAAPAPRPMGGAPGDLTRGTAGRINSAGSAPGPVPGPRVGSGCLRGRGLITGGEERPDRGLPDRRRGGARGCSPALGCSGCPSSLVSRVWAQRNWHL